MTASTRTGTHTVTPVILSETPRSRCTVEIESWARGGTPKVSVRVDDDNIDQARIWAVQTYLDTVRELERAERMAADQRAAEEADEEEED